MQLGVYSFGTRERNPDTGKLATTAQATRNLYEAVKLADEVGLDYFGIGEHHTEASPASAAATILAGAATVTSRILLGSAVTVLSTEDPVRVYQQFATLDALSNGRAEITAGRGSSTGEDRPGRTDDRLAVACGDRQRPKTRTSGPAEAGRAASARRMRRCERARGSTRNVCAVARTSGRSLAESV